MDINVQKETILNIVSTAVNYMPKNDMALSDKLTFASNNGKFSVLTTNYIESISFENIEYQAEDLTDNSFKAFSIDGKKVLAFLKSAKNEIVKMQIKEDLVIFQSGRTSAKIETIEEVFDFEINKDDGLSLNIGELTESFAKTFHSIDSNNPKPSICGLNLSSKDGVVNLVSTDTRRLTLITEKVEIGDCNIIIPKDGVSTIIKLFKGLDINAFISEKQLSICTENLCYSVKMINDEFPQWQRIVPTSFNQEISLNKNKLIELIKEASLFQSKVELNIAEGKISLHDVDGNCQSVDTVEEQEVQLRIRFESKYFLDFLNSYIGEDVTLSVSESNLPIVLTADTKHKEIIMPIVIES